MRFLGEHATAEACGGNTGNNKQKPQHDHFRGSPSHVLARPPAPSRRSPPLRSPPPLAAAPAWRAPRPLSRPRRSRRCAGGWGRTPRPGQGRPARLESKSSNRQLFPNQTRLLVAATPRRRTKQVLQHIRTSRPPSHRLLRQ